MKTKLIFGSAVALIFSLYIFSACTKDVGKIIVETPKVDTTKTVTQIDPCDTITYTKHIRPIVTKICLKCHGDLNPSSGYSLNSYDLLKAKGQSGALAARVINGPNFMPKGRAAFGADTTSLFNCWIKKGFKQ